MAVDIFLKYGVLRILFLFLKIIMSHVIAFKSGLSTLIGIGTVYYIGDDNNNCWYLVNIYYMPGSVLCVCLCAKSVQSYLTLCNPVDCILPGPSVHEILQARISEGCHALLQEIFPTQISNPRLLCLLHWQAGSLPPTPLGSPHVTFPLIFANSMMYVFQLRKLKQRNVYLSQGH